MSKHQPITRPVRKALGALGFILLVLGGCATQRPQPPAQRDLSELDRIQPNQILMQAKQVPPPGPPPFVEQMTPLIEDVRRTPNLYALAFDNAPLGEVITALVGGDEFNLSVESEIDLNRAVTVRLKNVTLEEALDRVVVEGAGYAWVMENDTLRIKRFTERIYHLDYLDLVGETEIDVGGDMLGSGAGEDAGVTGKYQIKAKKPEQASDLWAAVESALDGIKSAEGLLRVNRNAGVIYMADTPRRIASMVRFLDSLSESLHRQVFIEARILAVVLREDNKLGIDWTQLNVAFTSQWGGWPDVFELAFNGGGSIVKSSESRFQAMLDFLKTQGDVRVLSNPHLSVMNRQSALLTVGYQFPYTDIDGVDRDLETGVVTIGTSIRRAVLGLQLGLTPQISQDGMVTFHIVPTITRIEREVDLEIPTTGLTSTTISNPVIDLQELATMVRVRDGNSFVLAGLINKIRTIGHESLPLLGDMPWLGELFRQIKTTEENSELVIFITPYIRNGV